MTPLIGIATGAVSGVDLLDADTAKREPAREWWHRHHAQVPPTRTFRSGGKAIDGALRTASDAAEGNRNAALFWSACRMGERIAAGQITEAEATRALLNAAKASGAEGATATNCPPVWRNEGRLNTRVPATRQLSAHTCRSPCSAPKPRRA